MKCSVRQLLVLVLLPCLQILLAGSSPAGGQGLDTGPDGRRGNTGESGGPSNLRAAAAKVDITPPVGTRLAGFSDREGGSTGIKDSLRAGVLVLDDGRTRAALITLDLINVGDDETAMVREMVGTRAGIPKTHILVAASHTHGGPPFDATTDYARQVAEKIASAAAGSLKYLRPVTIGYSIEEMTACVNRRLVNEQGVAEMKPDPAGPIDSRVRVLRLDGSSDEPVAVLVHVACHANVFRSANTEVTADYPGLVQQFVEGAFDGAPTLFMAGAGGNIRPNLPSDDGFRNGDDGDLKWVGLDIGAAAVQAGARAGSREELARRDSTYQIASMIRTVELPEKNGKAVAVEIQALRVGKTLFLTIPGEPFVEYAMQIEQALPDDVQLFVVGYANGHHGYLCTKDSYRYGGYEPGVSKLAPEAEAVLIGELLRLSRLVL